jgi:hypothetical protein
VERDSLRDVIASDAYAATFQSLAQYRTSILKHIDNLGAAERAHAQCRSNTMDDNHYHGRIAALLNSFQRAHALVPEDRRDHAANLINWAAREFKRPGDARRLIACWNAFVGIDTALIEDGRLFAVLQPPAPFTAAATQSFMLQLGDHGWRDYTGGSVAPIQRLLNDLLQKHAPAARISAEVDSCSRTNNEQERSYQLHGADFKERMLAAFAFCRQLEIELTIARDLLRVHEEAAASRATPPAAPDDQAPARTEGAKP